MKTFIILLGLVATAWTEEKPKAVVRVFVTDRDSYRESTFVSANAAGATASTHAGVRRTNAEQIKTLSRECPAVTITGNIEKADFIVVWDSKTWGETPWSGKMNEYTVYERGGDLISSGGADKMSNAAKNICKAIVSGGRQ